MPELNARPVSEEVPGTPWPLRSNPGNIRSFIYGLQWFVFAVAHIAVTPIIIGPHLGLDQIGIAELAQRMFLVVGVASLLQIYFGHRLPAIEGPAALWWAVYISLAQISVAVGRPLGLLRSDIVGMLLLSGTLLLVFGLTGMIGRVIKYFTPPITGCMLILLCLTLSGNFIKGVVDPTGSGSINYLSLTVATVVIATIILIVFKGSPLLKTINVLVGLAVGWLLFLILQPMPLASSVSAAGYEIFDIPKFFAWGWPTFDPGVLTAGVFVSLIMIANLVASVAAMSRVTASASSGNTYDRAVIFTGIGNFLAGVGSSVGTVPFAASSGLVRLSGVASRKPFIFFCLMLITIGFLPAAGVVISYIPKPVGYAVFIAAFTQILIIGLHDIKKMILDQRDSYIIGLPLIIGAGIIALPDATLASLPEIARYIFGNGLITGMIICILMEHVFLPRKRQAEDLKVNGGTD